MKARARFTVGECVTRPEDVFDARSRIKRGTVTECYDYHSRDFGYYPELYAVRWGDGSEQRGFLPHGLDSEASS
jgi:hypothetical protein